MFLESELSHVNSRFTSYLDNFLKTSFIDMLTVLKKDERINIIFLYSLLIHFYSGKLTDIEREYSKVYIYIKLLLVISFYTFKKCIREISISFFISIFSLLMFKLNTFETIYIILIIYVFLVSVLFIVTRTIIKDGRLVIDSQKALDIENEINVFIGEESLEVMLSNDVAIGLINRYSDDLIYKLAYDNSLDVFKLIFQADREILDFAAKMHLRKLIDNKGRSFQIAGLVSALNIAYSKIVTSINESIYDDYSIRNLSLNALKVYNYGIQNEVVNNLNVFVDNLLKEGSFDIDYIESIDIIESLIIILMCKDRLMELKERYKKFDNM